MKKRVKIYYRLKADAVRKAGEWGPLLASVKIGNMGLVPRIYRKHFEPIPVGRKPKPSPGPVPSPGPPPGGKGKPSPGPVPSPGPPPRKRKRGG